jgi:hypothetical protein
MVELFFKFSHTACDPSQRQNGFATLGLRLFRSFIRTPNMPFVCVNVSACTKNSAQRKEIFHFWFAASTARDQRVNKAERIICCMFCVKQLHRDLHINKHIDTPMKQ